MTFNTLNLHDVAKVLTKGGQLKNGEKYIAYTFTDSQGNETQVTAFYAQEQTTENSQS